MFPSRYTSSNRVEDGLWRSAGAGQRRLRHDDDALLDRRFGVLRIELAGEAVALLHRLVAFGLCALELRFECGGALEGGVVIVAVRTNLRCAHRER